MSTKYKNLNSVNSFDKIHRRIQDDEKLLYKQI